MFLLQPLSIFGHLFLFPPFPPFCLAAEKMSQKDLALACAEPATVINAYEAGKVSVGKEGLTTWRPPSSPLFSLTHTHLSHPHPPPQAIPNGALIAKLERVLGVRLPRPAKR